MLAGFAGGVGGAITGVNAWAGAKDHQGKAVMDAINKRNAADIQRGASGSTLFGRASATGHRLFQGEGATTFDSQSREIAQKKGIDKSAKDLFSYLEGKGKTDGATYGVTTAGIEALGNARVSGSLNEFNRLKAAALAREQHSGNADDAYFNVTDSEGRTHRINAHDAVATKIEEELSYAAGDEWALRQEYGGRNGIRMKALKDSRPELSDDQRKDIIRGEVRSQVAAAHADWTDAQIAEETARRTSAFSADNGYSQKRDTYNESLNGVEDRNKHGLYTRYGATEADNGDLSSSFYATKLKKTSKAAGGEAGRLESSDAYKKQQADYGATKK